MTIEQMRENISKAYPSDKWKFRVKTMPENQVIAIYYSFQQHPPKVEKKKKPKKGEEQYEQISMDI